MIYSFFFLHIFFFFFTTIYLYIIIFSCIDYYLVVGNALIFFYYYYYYWMLLWWLMVYVCILCVWSPSHYTSNHDSNNDDVLCCTNLLSMIGDLKLWAPFIGQCLCVCHNHTFVHAFHTQIKSCSMLVCACKRIWMLVKRIMYAFGHMPENKYYSNRKRTHTIRTKETKN